MKNWRQATQRYLLAKKKVSALTIETGKGTATNPPLDLVGTENELFYFLATEGRDGVELLKASRQHIILGENYDGGGVGEAFFLDGTGLRKSTESMGLGAAYNVLQGGESRKPSIVDSSCHEAVRAAVQFGKMKPSEIVPFIRKQLDRIARKAPKVE